MFNKKQGKQRYFSVNYTTQLGSAQHVPQVCYKLTDDLVEAVEKMARDKLAVIYDKEVRFVSGVPMELKESKRGIPIVAGSARVDFKRDASAEETAVNSSVDSSVDSSKSKKKGKREFD